MGQGYVLVGVVEAVGAGCTIAVGQRVAAMPQSGCLATHRLLPEALALPIRDDVSPERVAPLILTGVTAHQLLHRMSGGRKIGPGTSILVHACTGGTGAMIVTLAKLAGVTSIFGTCSARNLESAAARGVRAFDYAADWAGAVRAAILAGSSGGRVGSELGLDLVFDSVLLRGNLNRGLGLLKRGGKLLGYGLTSKDAPGTFSLPSVIYTLLCISAQEALWRPLWDGRGAEFYVVSERRDARPGEYRADLDALLALEAEGALRAAEGPAPTVWRGLESGKDALVAIERGTHVGKQVVVIADT